ncbi:MAG: response regulator transcription factor [Syntrophobacterales bacterium]|nr:response regulator transcription factor [Syntrophobacterales bacterium]
MRVLIAEDDPTTCSVLKAILSKAGYEVITVSNGLEAWKILQRPDAPRLVILDWIMPEMDGLEVLRLVRTNSSDKPPYIIMLTSKMDKSDVVAALKAGADDYLTKPCDLNELKARLEVGRRIIGMQDALSEKIQELSRALAEIKTLRGILPICAHCKKIRSEKGEWIQIEKYICSRTEAEFSHALCPECLEKFFPEVVSGSKMK